MRCGILQSMHFPSSSASRKNNENVLTKNHLAGIIYLIGSCEATFDKRRIYAPNYDYRVREAVPIYDCSTKSIILTPSLLEWEE